MNEHGYCPNCNLDLDGGLIYETFLEKYQDEELALESAASYGATKTTGKWGKRIGVYSMEEDRTTHWRCPECGHEWPR